LTTAPTASATTIFFVTSWIAIGYCGGCWLHVAGSIKKDIAFVNPYFDTDTTKGRVCMDLGVINVRTQRVQRHAALTLVGHTGDFCATETTRTLDLDALGSQPHGALYCLLHGTLVRHTLVDLFADALGNQLRFQFGLVNFGDIDLELLTEGTIKDLAEFFELFAALADHSTHLGGVYGDFDTVC
jgi:hypothetical protein